jgi:hypothetical protein
MKKYIIFSIIFFFLFTFSQVFSAEDKTPGLRISNKCEENFPAESRSNKNEQYKLAYDRCIGVYSSYSGTLDQIIIQWGIAAKTNKVDDWKKVDDLLYSLYDITMTYGEMLSDWFNRDLLLTDISVYRKKVAQYINDATLAEAESKYSNNLLSPIVINKGVVSSNNQSSGAIIGDTLTGSIQVDKNICKWKTKWNSKLKKCMKIVQKAKK